MADDKIVTKKTAIKPAATTTKAPPKAAPNRKAPLPAPAGVKKTAAKATAAPKAGAVPRPAPAPRPPVASPAPRGDQPKAAASRPTATKAAAKKAPAARPAPKPAAQRALEEKPVSLQHLAKVSPDQRLDMIREAAYYKAEKRQFAPGHDDQNWAEAEREIDELLSKARKIYRG